MDAPVYTHILLYVIPVHYSLYPPPPSLFRDLLLTGFGPSQTCMFYCVHLGVSGQVTPYENYYTPHV